ncbi:hypothetical protein HYW42_03000 [Candidatus Daviesbacteria bacterium]|nr:hypothetical protein [Candidatus Daviesbacteria bacterium]
MFNIEGIETRIRDIRRGFNSVRSFVGRNKDAWPLIIVVGVPLGLTGLEYGFIVPQRAAANTARLSALYNERSTAEATRVAQQEALRKDFEDTGGVDLDYENLSSVLIRLRASAKLAKSREDVIAEAFTRVNNTTGCLISSTLYLPEERGKQPIRNEAYVLTLNCGSTPTVISQ